MANQTGLCGELFGSFYRELSLASVITHWDAHTDYPCVLTICKTMNWRVICGGLSVYKIKTAIQIAVSGKNWIDLSFLLSLQLPFLLNTLTNLFGLSTLVFSKGGLFCLQPFLLAND
ncbi:MAG: hypothetical protein HRT35_12510 [Algicola sp.]|nr:hypothetical protein [Algicola sp.]